MHRTKNRFGFEFGQHILWNDFKREEKKSEDEEDETFILRTNVQ